MEQDRIKLLQIIQQINDYLTDAYLVPYGALIMDILSPEPQLTPQNFIAMDSLNQAVKSYNKSESIIERITVLRTSAAFRDHLSEWKGLAHSTKMLCEEQGVDPNVVMIGLLDN